MNDQDRSEFLAALANLTNPLQERVNDHNQALIDHADNAAATAERQSAILEKIQTSQQDMKNVQLENTTMIRTELKSVKDSVQTLSQNQRDVDQHLGELDSKTSTLFKHTKDTFGKIEEMKLAKFTGITGKQSDTFVQILSSPGFKWIGIAIIIFTMGIFSYQLSDLNGFMGGGV